MSTVGSTGSSSATAMSSAGSPPGIAALIPGLGGSSIVVCGLLIAGCGLLTLVNDGNPGFENKDGVYSVGRGLKYVWPPFVDGGGCKRDVRFSSFSRLRTVDSTKE